MEFDLNKLSLSELIELRNIYRADDKKVALINVVIYNKIGYDHNEIKYKKRVKIRKKVGKRYKNNWN